MSRHHQSPAPVASFVLLFAAAGVSAQLPHRQDAAAQASPAPAPTALRDPWRVPIHARPAGSDALQGEPGWWAYGATFKASFHDGFSFHPVLGRDHPEELPWRWTTESVTAGGVPVVEAAARPAHAHTDWRYEYRWPGMTEAYDVREDGVEQTFVFARAPREPGDLVVRGRIDTRLRLDTSVPPAGVHQALTFTDAQDRPIVQYGAAFAFDAAGRRTDVATSWDAGRVTLTVPGAWLAQATWPVTIDPLTSSVVIDAAGAGLSEVVVEHEHESARFNTMVFYTRASSATRYDGVARLCDDDFQNSVPVFANSTLLPFSGQIDVAFVADADRWLLTFVSETGHGRRVFVHFHDKGNLNLNSGVSVEVAAGPTAVDQSPALGGCEGSPGSDGLLVFVRQSSASSKAIMAARVAAASRAVLVTTQLSPASNDFDVGFPDVTSASSAGNSSWIAVWQQRNAVFPNDDTKTFAARVTPGLTVAGTSLLGPSGGAPVRHKIRPRVDGRGGRYLVAMLRSDTVNAADGTDIVTERFDWPDNAAQPTRHGTNVLSTAFAQQPFSRPHLAFDEATGSHWCLAWQVAGSVGFNTTIAVRRLGHSGGLLESASIGGSSRGGPFGPALAFNRVRQEFQVLYCTPTLSTNGVIGQRLQHPADAINVPYGTGCGTGTISAAPPHAGSDTFSVVLSGPPPGTPCVLFFNFAPASIPLDGAGMPGCAFNVDPAGALLAFPSFVVSNASVVFPLPDRPVFTGDLHFQWLFLQLGLNPAGLAATQGLRAQVR